MKFFFTLCYPKGSKKNWPKCHSGQSVSGQNVILAKVWFSRIMDPNLVTRFASPAMERISEHDDIWLQFIYSIISGQRNMSLIFNICHQFWLNLLILRTTHQNPVLNSKFAVIGWLDLKLTVWDENFKTFGQKTTPVSYFLYGYLWSRMNSWKF